MTDPDPSWHPEGLHRFDLGGIAQDDGEEIVPRVARLMGNALLAAAGGCASDPCRVSCFCKPVSSSLACFQTP